MVVGVGEEMEKGKKGEGHRPPSSTATTATTTTTTATASSIKSKTAADEAANANTHATPALSAGVHSGALKENAPSGPPSKRTSRLASSSGAVDQQAPTPAPALVASVSGGTGSN